MSYEIFDYNVAENSFVEERLRVLKFSSEGCPWCKAYEPVIKEELASDSTIDIIEIGFSHDMQKEEKELVLSAIEGFPTLIAIDKNGEECERLLGYKTSTELHNWLDDAKSNCGFKDKVEK